MPIGIAYFETRTGEILLPPTSDSPTPPNCIRKEANYINEVHDLERRLQLQESVKHEQELERDSLLREEVQQRVRRNLLTLLESSSTDAYTKDFIRGWMSLKNEQRRDYFRNAFRAREVYLEGLHYDRPQTIDEVMKESDV